MTRDELQSTVLALPAAERRELVEVLWESLESHPEPITDWQRRLLDERLAALDAEPEAGADWQDVERRALGSSEALRELVEERRTQPALSRVELEKLLDEG